MDRKTEERCVMAAEKGLESFWKVIASRFPEVKKGDTVEDWSVDTQEIMREIVVEWFLASTKKEG